MKTCPTCQAGYPTNFAVCPQDGTPLVEVGLWSPGSVIRGKYRILNKIGQGGMGAVYKALHVTFDELRAIKVISAELIHDQLFVKRFQHEAVITRKLQHPNAVRVDDIDEAEDGRPFIVMEYIEGQSLRKLIEEQGAMPVDRACSVIKQAAEALDAAHRLGMIHRDIKPDNIVLIQTPEGEQAKVLDFGIAKIKEGGSGETGGMTLTGTGVVIGTPQYMSPEQAMGKRGDQLDGRSDLYSLGIVMYQTLTGELPFKADTTMEMLIAHLQQPAPNVRAVRPELHIPDPIAQIVMRLLEKKPEHRPRTARALIEEIEAAESAASGVAETQVVTPLAIHEQPIGMPPAAPAAPMPRSVSRRSGVTTAPTSPPIELPTPETPPRPPAVQPRAAQSRPAPAPPRDLRAAPQVTRAKKPSQVGIWAALGILAISLTGGVWYFTERQPSVGPGPQDLPAQPPPPGQIDVTPAKDNDIAPGQQSPVENQSRDVKPNNPPAFVEPPPPSPAPTATLIAEPRTVEKGNPIKLRWRSDNATQLELQPGVGVVQARGSTSVTPNDSTIYVLVAKGPGGSTTARARVRVTVPPPPKPRRAVDPSKIRAAIKMGQFYLDRGDYDKAINEYRQGLEIDPSNQQLRNLIQRARRAKAAEALLNQ